MTRHFLWCRAWPWHLPAFPFARVELLEGKELEEALGALVLEWNAAHPGELEEARSEEERMSRRRDAGTPSLPTQWARTGTRKRRDLRASPTFREVAILAGWIRRPHGVVMHRGNGDEILQTSPVYFHATDDEDVATGILEALCQRIPTFRAGGPFGSGEAILRYGAVSTNHMDRTRRVLVQRSLDEFQGRRMPAWALAVVQEALEIEGILTSQPGAEDTAEENSETRSATSAPTRTVAEGNARSTLDPAATAMGLLLRYAREGEFPSIRQLASEVGVSHTTLSRNAQFKAAWSMLKQHEAGRGEERIRRGKKDPDTGEIIAPVFDDQDGEESD
jgi:hypothetical protein